MFCHFKAVFIQIILNTFRRVKYLKICLCNQDLQVLGTCLKQYEWQKKIQFNKAFRKSLENQWTGVKLQLFMVTGGKDLSTNLHK